VTVTHTSGLFTTSTIVTSKKKPLQPFRLKRLGISPRGGRSGQGGCLFRSRPIPPRRRAHGGCPGAARGRGHGDSTSHKTCDNIKRRLTVSNSRPFSSFPSHFSRSSHFSLTILPFLPDEQASLPL
jgi:hypothetical protein